MTIALGESLERVYRKRKYLGRRGEVKEEREFSRQLAEIRQFPFVFGSEEKWSRRCQSNGLTSANRTDFQKEKRNRLDLLGFLS